MEALLAFWDGAFGSAFAVLSATLVRATPLLFVGLAVALAFRAGVLNIGAEGQLVLGAIGASAVALATPTWPRALVVLAMLLAGAAAGGLWAGIAALLRRRFHVLEVISTIMLNFVAAALVSWMVRGPLQEPTRVYPMSESFAAAARWPFLVPGQRLHLGFALGLLAAGMLWFVLRHTAAGFRIRAVGAGPRAAASAGAVDVSRVTARAFIASGALAGLAGASEVGGVTWALYEGISPGYGYTAIAVALLARLDPRWVVVTAIGFGALEAGGAAMQRTAGVPAVAVQIVTATTLLAVLGATRWRARRRREAGA
ncbi:ABC transporter permease [Pseudogemmatithrix spongiicola]|uniref:ABC transporter permease n=1 Tax=Pseudogemmatithrix spongiicola TaxID=3062599 RepID=A0AA49Q5V4_9BACT|nr:ABC transporter permease [Gemmatimonadaceae bacterium 'strain 138']WKW13693.1 ABC transporter permease [Gemmatimonadaceae bacterium 'strain 318']